MRGDSLLEQGGYKANFYIVDKTGLKLYALGMGFFSCSQFVAWNCKGCSQLRSVLLIHFTLLHKLPYVGFVHMAFCTWTWKPPRREQVSIGFLFSILWNDLGLQGVEQITLLDFKNNNKIHSQQFFFSFFFFLLVGGFCFTSCMCCLKAGSIFKNFLEVFWVPLSSWHSLLLASQSVFLFWISLSRLEAALVWRGVACSLVAASP